MASQTYEVTCRCGRALRGARARRHQVLACPACGRGVFVLPGVAAAVPAATPRSRWRAWRWPLIAGGLCLLAVIVGYAVALRALRSDRGDRPRLAPSAETIRTHVEAGTKALAHGSFHIALRELNLAVALRERAPDLLTPAEHRALNQLQRQADLMAHLSHLTLEEIVARGKLVRNPDEWADVFADFRGRGVIFDDHARRDGDGRPALVNHTVEVGDERVRLALEDVAVLNDLPLGDEPRLIFGAKLQSVAREEGGGWVVRFEPDSGVLFTEAEAVEACFPVAPGGELREVMQRQRRWLDERPTAPAARR